MSTILPHILRVLLHLVHVLGLQSRRIAESRQHVLCERRHAVADCRAHHAPTVRRPQPLRRQQRSVVHDVRQ